MALQLATDPKLLEEQKNRMKYTVCNGEVTINHWPQTPGIVEIPTYIDGHPVVALGNHALSDCREMTSLILPHTLRRILSSACFDCIALNDVEIPYGVKHIGSRAFAGCTALKEVALPDTVTYIGSEAFAHCTALISAKLPDSITHLMQGVFDGCTNLQYLQWPVGIAQDGPYEIDLEPVADEFSPFFLDEEDIAALYQS